MKLGSETAKQAWADFEQYLKDVALAKEGQNLYLAKMAFLHAFAAGQAHKVEAAPAVSIDNKVITQDRPKKAYTKGNSRTDKERQTQARLVASILQTAKRPMQLREIIQLVNETGANWNPNSASGFVQDAMNYQPCVKKVGYGVYEYEM